MTEQCTAFLSKVPACLQEFEDIMHGAARWLDEAQSWLSAPCSFPTARGHQNHANSLQAALMGGTTMVMALVLPEQHCSLLDAYGNCRALAAPMLSYMKCVARWRPW
ncbi:uncharacterized protein LOC120807883 isoform X2 [Gasterosteus aculeatus]